MRIKSRCVAFGLVLCALTTSVLADAALMPPFVDELWRIRGTHTNGVVPAAELVVLVAEGKPEATIILPEDAPLHTQRGAERIVEYVQLMSGATLPIVTDPDAVQTEHRIWVGMRPELAERFPDLDFEFSKPEEFLIHAKPKELVIVGRDRIVDDTPQEAATKLAALTFIEERLGVRWFWPGQWGTDLFESAHIAFEPFDYRYHPQLRFRAPQIWNATSRWNQSRRMDNLEQVRAPNKIELRNKYVGDSDEAMRELAQQRDHENQAWLNLHRGNRGPGDNAVLAGSLTINTGHAFTDWSRRFAEDHPEWFALHPDGTRASEQEEPYPNFRHMKLCISNPEVAEQWLKDAEAYLNENPLAVTVSASPNDFGWRGYCMCENCKAWDPPDAPALPRPIEYRDGNLEYGQLTDRYVRFWNILARGLKERFPDREVALATIAYHVYRPSPYVEKLEDNIYLSYVGIRERHFTNNKVSMMQTELANWKGWHDAGIAGINWRPNSLKRNAAIPYVYLHRHGQNWNTLANQSLVGFSVDSFHHHWSTQGVQYYLIAKLMWNPHKDYREILDDYYTRAFGPDAAPYVRAYFDVFEQVYMKVAEVYGGDAAMGWRQWQQYSGLPHAFRELRVAPTLGRDQSQHTWGNFLWEEDGPRYHGEQLAKEYLEMAEAAVADGPEKYKERVAFLRVGFDYTVSVLDVTQALNQLRHRQGDLEDALARAWEAVERREQIMFENIHTSALGYFQEIRQYRYRFPDNLALPSADMIAGVADTETVVPDDIDD